MYLWLPWSVAVATHHQFINYTASVQVIYPSEKAELKYADGENWGYLWQLANARQVREMMVAQNSHAEQSHKCLNQCGTRNLCLLTSDYESEQQFQRARVSYR